ncbi:MAG TPA: VWA domain-containing protein [Vicinamibacteria bacterium]|nr:VWA domain-containing protein [Vicinamibacteria bacterium]
MGIWKQALATSLVAAFLPAVPAAAQPVAADRVPVFGSAVGVVVLDLVVRDRKGNLVRDLRSDEIEIWEDGIRQGVTEFRTLPAGGGTTVSTAVPGPLSDARRPALPATTAAPADRRPRASLVSFVFDQLSVEGRSLAFQAAERFLDAQAGSETYVAVFRIDGRLKLAQGFTRDTAALKRSLEAATLGSAPAFTSNVTAIGGQLGQSPNAGDPLQKGYDHRELRPAHHEGDPEAGTPMDGDGSLAAERNIANAMVNILRTAEDMERTERGTWSLDGLLALVHGQGSLPGRKTVVYFSEGLQVPPQLEDPFRSLMSEANQANVSIYAVDVRGLGAAGNMAAARELLDQAVAISTSQRLSGGNWHGVTREQAREFEAVEATLRMNAQGTLEDLARGTGGFLIAESNDLKVGFLRLGEEIRGYYEVAYAPSDDHFDGRFRRVAVKVKRAGVSVQSRNGYFAVPRASSRPIMGYEAPLLSALGSRQPPHDFEHQAAVFRFDANADLVRHGLAVAVPLSRVAFAEDRLSGRYAGRVSILALVRDARGDIVQHLGQDYHLEGPLGDLAAARRRRITFSRNLLLRPGTYVVDTAVRDGFGQRIGCRRLPLAVASPAPGVRLSSMVALAGAVPATGAGEEQDDPFRLGDVRMTPSLEPKVRLGPGQDTLALYYVVYGQEGVREPPSMTLEIGRAGRLVKRGSIALPPPDASGRIPHVASVPVGTLAPGDYTLRLNVTQAGSSAAEQRIVEVRSGGE